MAIFDKFSSADRISIDAEIRSQLGCFGKLNSPLKNSFTVDAEIDL